MSDLRCPYLGCQKAIPLTEDFTCHRPGYTICPHCGREVAILTATKKTMEGQGSTIPVPNRPMNYIQNEKGDNDEIRR